LDRAFTTRTYGCSPLLREAKARNKKEYLTIKK
jgi:hypothetical protein